jgi:hypothetical protein
LPSGARCLLARCADLAGLAALRRILVAYSCERNYWNYNRLEDVGGWRRPPPDA